MFFLLVIEKGLKKDREGFVLYIVVWFFGFFNNNIIKVFEVDKRKVLCF